MTEIPLARLALILLPLIAVGFVSYRWGGSTKELLIASCRMVVQLLAMGYVLVFLFTVDRPLVGVAIVAFMIAVSSWIAVRTVHQFKREALIDAVFGIGASGAVMLALVVLGVLHLRPWYQPNYVIPLAGMIFSNAMTAVTLSAERFYAERNNGKDSHQARNIGWNAALIPQINSFLAVGLVSLPGMMTGQILAGTSPLEAVRYQILVMGMVLGSAGIAVAIFLSRVVARETS